jgi:hypothetical protein
MDRETLRRTLGGAAIGGLLFGGLALLQAIRSGAPFPAVLQPVGVVALIGLTVGGLAGPLVGQALARRRGG